MVIMHYFHNLGVIYGKTLNGFVMSPIGVLAEHLSAVMQMFLEKYGPYNFRAFL